MAQPAGWEGNEPGLLRLYSGRTHEQLRTCVAPLGVEGFGFDLAGLPDVDGDGSGDLLARTADSRSQRCGFVISGTTGQLLFEIWCPAELRWPRVAPIGDVDGDGRVEIALTGTDETSMLPIALVCSGRDGHEIERLRGRTRNPHFGVRALPLGDLDGQGASDILLWSNTLLEAFSSEEARLLFTKRTQLVPYVQYEAGCGLLGDVDGDGLPDFVLANPEDGCFGFGSVACRSGWTGKPIWEEPPWQTWRNVELSSMGKQLAVIGDFDRDGVRDFIWATDNGGHRSPGLVFISSGKTGRALNVLARGPNLEILRLGPKE